MNKFNAGLAALALALVSAHGHASHKSWTLVNSGNQCSSYHPGNSEWYGDTFTWSPYPDPGTTLGVTCPVSLAGRWGSSGTAPFPPARWARVMYANLYANVAPGKTLTCKVAARMNSNTLYWSQSRTNLGSGLTRVELVPYSGPMQTRGIWGGTLEAHKQEEVKSMDVYCDLPTNSWIEGYKVRVCMSNLTEQCTDNRAVDNDNGSIAPGYYSPVQTSGIECVAENHYGDLRRSEYGIKNHLSAHTGEEFVRCPVSPPANDSYRHFGNSSTIKVHYDAPGIAGAYQAGCATVYPPKCPVCQLSMLDYSGNTTYSSTFTYASSPGAYHFVEAPVNITTGWDKSMSVRCELPPQETIVGVSSVLSLSQNAEAF